MHPVRRTAKTALRAFGSFGSNTTGGTGENSGKGVSHLRAFKHIAERDDNLRLDAEALEVFIDGRIDFEAGRTVHKLRPTAALILGHRGEVCRTGLSAILPRCSTRISTRGTPKMGTDVRPC